MTPPTNPDPVIPPPSDADLQRSIKALYHDSFLPEKHGASRVEKAWAEALACVIRRCHAAEQDNLVLRKDVEAVGKFYKEKCKEHVAAEQRAEAAEKECEDMQCAFGEQTHKWFAEKTAYYSLRALLVECAAALQPFAEFADKLPTVPADMKFFVKLHFNHTLEVPITMGDCRRAAALHAKLAVLLKEADHAD